MPSRITRRGRHRGPALRPAGRDRAGDPGDPLGKIVQETRAIPTQGNQINTYVTKFQFDTWNRIASITYPDNPNGENVPYFYGFGGLPERVHGTDDQLEVDYASAISPTTSSASGCR